MDTTFATAGADKSKISNSIHKEKSMRKNSLIAAMLSVALASFAWGQSNANGIGYFALEVPADVTITIDGEDGDWAWFDPIFTVGPDEMYEIQKAEVLDKSDLDVAIMTAWTGTDRDNRLYGFVRATDDTLVVTSDVFDDGWRDDDLEIITDANASGGPHDGDGESGTRAEGQQFTMHLPVPGIYETPYGGDGSWWLRWQVVEEIHWMDEFAESRVTTNPPGATTGSTNVTVNYEYSIPLWDYASLDGADNSIRHDNEAGQIIRLTYQLNEADNPEDRRTHQLATTGEDGASGNCDVCSEYTLLGADEYDRADGGGTSVESESWAKIKATFSD